MKVAADGLVEAPGGRRREEQAAEKAVEKDLSPGLGNDVVLGRGERAPAEIFGRRLDPLRQKCLAAGGVQLQLLHSLGQRAEVIEQNAASGAGLLEITVSAHGQDAVPEDPGPGAGSPGAQG